MTAKSSTRKSLPKSKKEFLPLVQNLFQLSDSEKAYNHEFTNFPIDDKGGAFSVNNKGELTGLILKTTEKPNLDWDLISKCKFLEVLHLEGFKLEHVPDEVFAITGLTNLKLINLQLKEIPENICNLTLLESLDVSNNEIFELPKTTLNLINLKRVTLDDNKFTLFPEVIFNFFNLRGLSLCNNSIELIPSGIACLKKLTLLDISFNRLSALPTEIFELKRLVILAANNNSINAIPEAIGYSDELEFLNFSSNRIKKVPDSLLKLERLFMFDIEDNLVSIPDLSFHKLEPSEKIQTLLAIQSSKSSQLKQAKVLVVGDERVGKTSIINRMLGNPHNENQTSTQGIDISSLDFNEYKAHIWDFAGQELTHQTHQFFLTERSLYLYVIDAQKEDNQARDLHWFNTIKSYSENSPIIVVVNHCDQNLNYQFDLQRYQNTYQVVDVIYTSACNLNSLSDDVKHKIGDSIDKLNKSISRQLPKLPGIERQIPESWHIVKSAMETFKETQNVIEKNIYEDECEKAGVLGSPLQTALLKILNSIGTVIAYPDDFRLKLTQILKPEWVTNAVYKIVRSPAKNPGLYTEEAISEILKDGYSHPQQQWLIDLLIKFELGFRVSNFDLLIPMRLPSVMPEFDKSRYQQGLNIRFNYHRVGLLKSNVLPQLIVRMHPYVDENTTKYWRHGLFLAHGGCQGVIISDEPNQCIDVYLSTRDEDARALLQWLRSNLQKIEHSQIQANESEALPYKEEITIYDENYISPIGYVNYEKVERAQKKGKKTIEVEVQYPETGKVDDIDIEVAPLLGLYKAPELSYNIKGLTDVIVNILLRLTDFRSKIINEEEDDINDRLRESLISSGYSVKDQSRGGFSGSAMGVGERDLVMMNQFGQQATLIEAMCLNSVVKKTINTHYDKLINNYNTQGNSFDFLITYAKVKNTNSFWDKYQQNFNNIRDFSSMHTDKSVLKVGHSYIEMNGSTEGRKIVHIVINFGVKP
ncbi:COR domain-containing protein [Pseudoalteromonas sp. SIMBA_162]|uniref:COR domain-containing protein n=2 Tax=Gammaproteobacteria TaxID=1236 RepID=UPI003978E4E0